MHLDPERFAFLLLNSHSVVELALLRVLEDFEANPPPPPTGAAPGCKNELNDVTPADLEGLASLNLPIHFDFEKMMAQEMERQECEARDAAEEEELTEVFGDDTDFDIESETGEVDVERYLARVYEDLPKIGRRAARAFSRANLPALAARLEALPSDLPRLTGRLSAADMERWLALYEPANPLGTLLGEIRDLAR